MRRRPRIVKDFDVDNDHVMIDIKENFKEEYIHQETSEAFLGEDIRRKILIGILVLMVALYVLARLRL